MSQLTPGQAPTSGSLRRRSELEFQRLLEKLPVGWYTVMAGDGQETILWNGLDQSGVALAQEAAPEAAADKATAGKRKWHEKFKAQRKEIKK